MKIHFKRCALITFTMLAIVSPVHADIVGSYKCTGYDPFLSESYEIDLIIAKTADTYKLDWQEVNDSYVGTAIHINNNIASVFSSQGVQKKYGVIYYEVHAQNILKGKWTYQYKELVGTEECKKTN